MSGREFSEVDAGNLRSGNFEKKTIMIITLFQHGTSFLRQPQITGFKIIVLKRERIEIDACEVQKVSRCLVYLPRFHGRNSITCVCRLTLKFACFLMINRIHLCDFR